MPIGAVEGSTGSGCWEVCDLESTSVILVVKLVRIDSVWGLRVSISSVGSAMESRSSGHEWNAKQISDGDIEASGSSTFELQRKLVQSALSADSSGAVQSSFSYVTPSSAVFQVVIGGSSGGAFFGGGGAVATPAGGAAAAAEAPAAEEKKKEEEPESDDDMGFSLFD
ncbi:hypothetical protein SADUNF_Sadunf03G0005700 [Salix dunnii]|uniref:60S acidic ribosomal protein P3 n=1 Tax=Salix dunnii TaxID=1413687 RepID=A0A835KFL4_9ROSI|nr:hypothetical protein SADUNF_Sadunf03G0005700 [Salix dunnii]